MTRLISLVVHAADRHTSPYSDRRQVIHNGGWFNPAKAVFFRDTTHPDIGSVHTLYYTASGKWVLNLHTYEDNGRFVRVSTPYAEGWLRCRGYLKGEV